MSTLYVLAVVSELYPLVKTGGLADVAGALPGALAAEDVAVRSLLPGYPQVLGALTGAVPVRQLDALFGGPARLLSARSGGIELLVLDAPHLYQREGALYGWPDDALRFAALSRVAADIGLGLLPDYRPDVVHAHDWQAGLAPAYLHYAGGARPGTVMTVHNLAFQGQFPSAYLDALGLPSHAYAIDGVEYYSSIGYLKAGLQLADRITTVSPSYAQEIRTPEGGMGMSGLLRARAAVSTGILNGIDDVVWDPATDTHLAAQFDAAHLDARAANKAALQARFRLISDPSRLLFGAVTRLTPQKGTDLLLAAVPALLDAGAQLVLLGSGDAGLEAGVRTAAESHPGSVGIQLGYDEALAHLIQGGSDALLVPSRFEPCGLTQLCALRYGALPVVARVGGLIDTVIDANEAALAAGVPTGFQFTPVDMPTLVAAVGRVKRVWQDRRAWERMQRNAMAADVSWRLPAKQYAALFRGLFDGRR